MPIAGHIVHMPAHIYVRVGQYDKAIAQNVRSQAVDKEFLEIWGDHPFPEIGTYPLSARIHAPHAIDFIRYAATVQGKPLGTAGANNEPVKRSIARRRATTSRRSSSVKSIGHRGPPSFANSSTIDSPVCTE